LPCCTSITLLLVHWRVQVSPTVLVDPVYPTGGIPAEAKTEDVLVGLGGADGEGSDTEPAAFTALQRSNADLKQQVASLQHQLQASNQTKHELNRRLQLAMGGVDARRMTSRDDDGSATQPLLSSGERNRSNRRRDEEKSCCVLQ